VTAKPRNLRFDIQVLRGLAVLLVLFYHAGLAPLSGGYLGVDIFFVISGFLITTLIAEGIRAGNFSLRSFYFRRARRLLPAAYTTFLACLLLAPWVLYQQELRDFATQAVGALTFTGNIVLWQQTGYFEGSSELKPLLHVWSLALEEQYYFIMPALLLFLPQRRWRIACVLLLLASLALCIAGTFVKPIATFYLLPTRAWELLIGSVGALLYEKGTLAPAAARAARLLFLPAVALLLVLPVFPLPGPHPGWNALLACLSTVTVILARRQWPEQNMALRWIKGAGDMSYSLYLVHWPIIAFLHNAWVGEKSYPLWIKAATVLLSLALGWLQYRYVETRFRHPRGTLSGNVKRFAAMSLALGMATPAVLLAQSERPDFEALRRPNFGLSNKCQFTGNFTPIQECQSSNTPSLLLWGDSFAMHLAAGLASEWKADGGIVQATRSVCAPFQGIASMLPMAEGGATPRTRLWAEQCIAFNDSVIEYLRQSPHIRTVVLSSSLLQFFETNSSAVTLRDGQVQVGAQNPALLARHIAETVRLIESMGKKVAVIAPPPSAGFNIGGCLEKQATATIAFGGTKDCAVPRDAYQAYRAGPLELLAELEREHGITVLRLDSFLCNETACRTMADNVMLYRDEGHLSYAGSEWIAQHMAWHKLLAGQ
jgi:peptidoglycan/LPS O-acetylase OafA/YrhL